MRHRIAGRKFGRSAAHRQSMTRNQVTSLLRYGRITTTEAKAKELRRWVERVITDAKPDDLNARRKVALYVNDREVSNKLFSTYLERYKERPGGYTRVVKLPPRPSDATRRASTEWVEWERATRAHLQPHARVRRHRFRRLADPAERPDRHG